MIRGVCEWDVCVSVCVFSQFGCFGFHCDGKAVCNEHRHNVRYINAFNSHRKMIKILLHYEYVP